MGLFSPKDKDWRKWESRINSARDVRTMWEPQVSTCSHFAAGIQNIWWDLQGNMRTKQVMPNEIFRIINLMPVYLNIIQSRLTSNDPRWNPERAPGAGRATTVAEKHAATALLSAVWEAHDQGDLFLKRIMKLAIRRGYLEGGAIAYNRFDEVTDMPTVSLFSMWDAYADTSAEDMYNKGHICFIIPKSLEWIKRQAEEKKTSDGDVGQGWSKLALNVEADGIVAGSNLKKEYLQRKNGGSKAFAPKTHALRYCFEYGSNGLRYSIVSAEGELFAQDLPDHTNLCDLFTVFHPVDTGDFYTRPPCMDWIDPQKTVNKMYSNIECYIDTFGQGKWILENEKTTIPYAGVTGQKIFANEGEVKQLEMLPLPSTHFQHLQNAISQYEQIAGVHGESVGRISGSADSGKAIAQLQALDEQNSTDAVDNFKLFLQQIGQKVLRDAARNWKDTKTLYRYDRITGKQTEMKVIGEKYYDARSNKTEDTMALVPFERMNVKMVIGEYYSETQRRKELTDLLQIWQPGVNRIQDRVMLPMIMDAFDIGVGQDIVEELRKMENPDQMIAEGKAMKIADGQRVIVNANDPHEFLANYYATRAQEYAKGGDMQSAQALNAQASTHNTFVQAGQGGAGNPNAPENIPEAAAAASATAGGTLPVGM